MSFSKTRWFVSKTFGLGEIKRAVAKVLSEHNATGRLNIEVNERLPDGTNTSRQITVLNDLDTLCEFSNRRLKVLVPDKAGELIHIVLQAHMGLLELHVAADDEQDLTGPNRSSGDT